MHVASAYQPLMRQIGLDAEAVFSHPGIVVWRSIRERENCTLDTDLPDGRHIRLHIKRHRAGQARRGRIDPAAEEARGLQLLESAGIATTPLVAWGALPDGRSFLITADLAGYQAADKLLAGGCPFDRLLEPTAELAARLHNAGLHHRDLYICHFFAMSPESSAEPSADVSVQPSAVDLRLIDAARVKTLPRRPLARRWIIKDLAQFWYSTLSLPITDVQRTQWLTHYALHRQTDAAALRPSIERKSARISRHDRRLRTTDPTRNVSITDR